MSIGFVDCLFVILFILYFVVVRLVFMFILVKVLFIGVVKVDVDIVLSVVNMRSFFIFNFLFEWNFFKLY